VQTAVTATLKAKSSYTVVMVVLVTTDALMETFTVSISTLKLGRSTSRKALTHHHLLVVAVTAYLSATESSTHMVAGTPKASTKS